MATDIPQRELRNRTADLLRRVEAGEQLRITMHGHPVAELVPIEEDLPARTFVPLKDIVEGLAGTLEPDDPLAEEVREWRDQGGPALDPFEKYERKRAGEKPGPEQR